uniref:Uncharacterized protein n=1 Tax=Onchocerca volvulus TaxID=6282 RepID=A0A8R1XW83_ONCVO
MAAGMRHLKLIPNQWSKTIYKPNTETRSSTEFYLIYWVLRLPTIEKDENIYLLHNIKTVDREI